MKSNKLTTASRPVRPSRTTKKALRRLGPPAAKLLPAARLGGAHPRDPAAARLGRRRLLPQRRHDPQQQKEGGQGRGRGRGVGVGGKQEKGVRAPGLRGWRGGEWNRKSGGNSH